MGVQRWTDDDQARRAPVGAVLYDDEDDVFTVKKGQNVWVAYHSQGHLYTLANADIDADTGDQIVGEVELT